MPPIVQGFVTQMLIEHDRLEFSRGYCGFIPAKHALGRTEQSCGESHGTTTVTMCCGPVPLTRHQPSWLTGHKDTDRSRTLCAGSATSPSTRTAPEPGPALDPT